MAFYFKIQNLHLPNVQVGDYPLFLLSSKSNFISISRNVTTSLPMNKLHSLSLSSSLSSSSSAVPISASESSNEHSFTVSYLINSCGLPRELALSRTRYVKFNSPEKPDAVLAFLKKHGFTKTQVSNIVMRYPQLLLCNPEKTLLPKLEFLSSLGLSKEEITDITSRVPLMLRRSLDKAVIPSFNILRNLLKSDDKVISAVKRDPSVLALVPEIDNIQILQEVGVPPENIVASMTFQHRGYLSATNNYKEIVDKVKEMGFDPSSMNFVWAIRTIRSMKESVWENKVQVFKKYGWSDQEVLLAFEKYPRFIMSSKEKIDGIMDFLVNQMGVEAATIANWPAIIGLSLKKRIVPRCSIYRIMLEKGLVERKQKLGIYTLLSFPEKQFLSRVIKPYEDKAPQLLTLYQEMLDI